MIMCIWGLFSQLFPTEPYNKSNQTKITCPTFVAKKTTNDFNRANPYDLNHFESVLYFSLLNNHSQYLPLA